MAATVTRLTKANGVKITGFSGLRVACDSLLKANGLLTEHLAIELFPFIQRKEACGFEMY